MFTRLIVVLIALSSLPGFLRAQGVDLQGYCQSRGSAGVQNVDGTGYGWRCLPNQSIDVNAACQRQYGPQAKAKLKSPPPGAAGDWICENAVVASGGTDPAIEEDVSWCLGGAANQTIVEQANAINRPYCQAIVVGAALTGVLGEIKDKKQNEWSRAAASLACNPNPQDQAIAVSALAACQCHDEGRAKRMLNNRITVIHALRRYAGCDNLGLPIF